MKNRLIAVLPERRNSFVHSIHHSTIMPRSHRFFQEKPDFAANNLHRRRYARFNRVCRTVPRAHRFAANIHGILSRPRHAPHARAQKMRTYHNRSLKTAPVRRGSSADTPQTRGVRKAAHRRIWPPGLSAPISIRREGCAHVRTVLSSLLSAIDAVPPTVLNPHGTS